MASLSLRQRLGIGLGALLLVLVVGYRVIRPFHLRWGATAEEVARAMPGDLARIGWTRSGFHPRVATRLPDS